MTNEEMRELSRLEYVACKDRPGETVTVTFTRAEWDTLARAAWCGAMGTSETVGRYEREGIHPRQVADTRERAAGMWDMVRGLRFALGRIARILDGGQ
jgi:hypothetical protein